MSGSVLYPEEPDKKLGFVMPFLSHSSNQSVPFLVPLHHPIHTFDVTLITLSYPHVFSYMAPSLEESPCDKSCAYWSLYVVTYPEPNRVGSQR